MLFNKLLTLSAVTCLAAATAIRRTDGGDSCPPSLQCCQQAVEASDPVATTILGLLNIVLDDLNVLVGLNCSPITVIGSGNGACSTGGTTVICNDNSHGSLISIGCIPIIL
ncbi:hypothetical protein E1B28_012179 [Marasmius oreades]|uniref:Hydrophobin n=1 Tax=Marasmius oreades TaxID=181124 RepID=A0A9P7UMZ0_9AGAR|nr:uncharacterized protein E1B28_012179 [Marasmius oreades]KAG7088157.1 hypothetical protein E1B28_012179 [Marasmius oreades]